MSDYDAVLFDSDGILVEPPAYETKVQAARAAFADVGVTEVSQAAIDDVVSGPTIDRVQTLCAEYGVDPDAFWAARERRDEQSQFEQFRTGSRTRYDDISAITELSQPCGVVSNNHHSTIEYVLDRFDIESLFETYYGRPKTIESLELKKPNTHYLEMALEDLNADTALYVGDSESDVIAANRAQVDSVFVRRPHTREVDLSATPTYEITGLSELPTHVD